MNSFPRTAFYRPCCRFFHKSIPVAAIPRSKPSVKDTIINQLDLNLKVPKAKTWSKTAVLKALSTTVGSEVTPEYLHLESYEYWNKYRALENKLDLQKSGRSAANYVIENHPELFKHDWGGENTDIFVNMSNEEKVQFAEEFPQKKRYEEKGIVESDKNKNMVDSVESFQQLLEDKKIGLAANMFVRLQENGVDIPQHTVNQFLGIVAFYTVSSKRHYDTRENPSSVPFITSRKDEPDDSVKLSYSIFNHLSSPLSVEDLSLWMLSLGETRIGCKAVIALYNEKVTEKMKLDIATYNHVLACILSDDPSIRYKRALSILKTMKRHNVNPNYETFVTFARILPSTYLNAHQCIDHFTKILLEMKELNIEYGPALFESMLAITIRQLRSENFKVVDAIFEFMKGKSFNLQSFHDVTAFIRILSLVERRMESVKKVMGILQHGNNSSILHSNFYCSSRFYNLFFKLLINNDTVENVMYYYRTLSPHRWCYSWKFRNDVVYMLQQHQRPEYLPILYAGMDPSAFNYESVASWLECAISTIDCADNDTKKQLKHIAMIEIKFSRFTVREKNWNDVMNMCFELILLTTDEIQDMIKTFNFLLMNTSALPILDQNLLFRFEDLVQKHQSKGLSKAIETYKRKQHELNRGKRSQRKFSPSGLPKNEQVNSEIDVDAEFPQTNEDWLTKD